MPRLAFPTYSVPPLLRNAIVDIQKKTLSPIGLVASSVLGGASLATQSGYDVLRPQSLSSPLAMYFLTIAVSGERKSTVDLLTLQPFRKFAECNPLFSEIFLGDVEKSKKQARFIYSDTTPFAFIIGLSEFCRSATLLEDEAGRIFEGRLIDDLGLLNKLWNGVSIIVDRKKTRITVESPRCTISWMIQPKTFRAALQKKGKKLHDSGFLARCLICEPITTQGTRYIYENANIDMSGHERYCERARELLESQIDFFVPGAQKLEQPRKLLSFDIYAQKLWIETFNDIESNISYGALLHEHPQYASKIAENIARLAGIFHVFEGKSGLLITEETLAAAIDVIYWYVDEYLYIFRDPDFKNKIDDDANILLHSLERFQTENSKTWFRINWLRQYGPNALRNFDRLVPVIEHLRDIGKILIWHGPKYMPTNTISKTAYIALNTPWARSAPIQMYVPQPIYPSQPLSSQPLGASQVVNASERPPTLRMKNSLNVTIPAEAFRI